MNVLIEFLKNHPNQASAFAAVSALLVSFVSILLTIVSLWIQRRHNFKSLKPIASLPVGDYENLIEVKLRNTGVGPLIVEKFTACDGCETKNNLISFMPEAPPEIYWDTFYDELDGLCVPPNEIANIIKLSGDINSGAFISFRDEVRDVLRNISIKVQYKDIYDRKMPCKSRDLEWFGRHIKK